MMMPVNIDKVKTRDTAVRNARILHPIYHDGFRFPPWSISWLARADNSVLKRATLLHHAGDDVAHCLEIATNREPVNIAMEHYYSRSKLEQNFGYRYGSYKKLSTSSSLAPNIAIVCSTPICRDESNGDDPDSVMLSNNPKFVNVINLIGYAFDSRKQADFGFFVQDGKLDVQALEDAYADMWYMAFFACATWFVHLREDEERFLMYIGVGAGAFRPRMIPQEELDALLRKAVSRAFQRAKRTFPRTPIHVRNMGNIPQQVFDMSDADLRRTLFVNAWDCWSMVGNGNYSDRSLDGIWGRHTAMAVLCWPYTNPYMQRVAVQP